MTRASLPVSSPVLSICLTSSGMNDSSRNAAAMPPPWVTRSSTRSRKSRNERLSMVSRLACRVSSTLTPLPSEALITRMMRIMYTCTNSSRSSGSRSLYRSSAVLPASPRSQRTSSTASAAAPAPIGIQCWRNVSEIAMNTRVDSGN